MLDGVSSDAVLAAADRISPGLAVGILVLLVVLFAAIIIITVLRGFDPRWVAASAAAVCVTVVLLIGLAAELIKPEDISKFPTLEIGSKAVRP